MTPDPEDLPYRPCVGLVLFNNSGLVFAGRRIDTVAEAWQLPQGGIDADEDPEETLFREMEEEIGTRNFTILYKSNHWLTYDLPPHLIGKVWKGRYRGQKQIWYAARLNGGEDQINVNTSHPEFNDYRWVRLADVPALAVDFKRDLYHEIIGLFGHLAHPKTERR